MSDQSPILDFGEYYPTAIEIGTTRVPVLVKNLTEAELDLFRTNWARYVDVRGTTPRTPEQEQEYEAKRTEFFERVICEMVRVDEGVCRHRGHWVTTGEGLLKMFHARKDVLAPLIGQVWLQNNLTELTRKNLTSPRASEPGSVPSIPARGGDGLGSIVTSAEPAATPPTEAATGSSDAPDAPSASSGETRQVH